MAPFNDNSIMSFGKYMGKKMANVPAPYLLWLYEKGCDHKGVKNYILANLEILKTEVSRIPKK
jgi:uncharacterized protein (DUF3820 family)